MKAKYGPNFLPQAAGSTCVTEGGLETTLIYLRDIELTDFAAYLLLRDSPGCKDLERYYEEYATLAQSAQTTLVLDTPTWRCNPDWLRKHGCDLSELQSLTDRAVGILLSVRERYESASNKIVITGCVGPRGDGYVVGSGMTVEEARDYHDAQISTFVQTEVDIVTMFTVNYIQEGIGAALAAKARGLPICISFTVETDGALPSGMPVREAIQQCDEATSAYPSYYMLNCAHPSHFAGALTDGWASAPEVVGRVRGVKVNASCKSHAELEASAALDIGDPQQLAMDLCALRQQCPFLRIFGGCCGTDTRHIAAMAAELNACAGGS